MIKFETKVRVRYGETDRMGYAYYGNYALYFEVARVEALKKLGFSYRKLEDDGILLPVRNYQITYLNPALYDDLLTIETIITEVKGAKISFDYKTFNEEGQTLNTATTTLVFVDEETRRPIAAPKAMIDKIKASTTDANPE